MTLPYLELGSENKRRLVTLCWRVTWPLTLLQNRLCSLPLFLFCFVFVHYPGACYAHPPLYSITWALVPPTFPYQLVLRPHHAISSLKPSLSWPPFSCPAEVLDSGLYPYSPTSPHIFVSVRLYPLVRPSTTSITLSDPAYFPRAGLEALPPRPGCSSSQVNSCSPVSLPRAFRLVACLGAAAKNPCPGTVFCAPSSTRVTRRAARLRK